ncbi:MAG: molybdopterin-binding protein [Treponema sp.]|nr:molybdopterin-binding protein [Treponema sp.]
MKLIKTEDAVGTVLCHDLTQIIKGVTKDARFRKGHIVTEEDIPVLLSMGKEHLYIWEQTPHTLHENDAALRLQEICQNDNMTATPVKEGKIELNAECDGVFCVNSKALINVNAVENITIATRHGNTAVKKGDKLAGFRVIPLVVDESYLEQAEKAAGGTPLLALHPWQLKTAAVITTGSEVYHGRIKDTFTPVIIEKIAAYGVSVIFHEYSDDKTEQITACVQKARESGAQLILCTGGMSVDPDDRTPAAIISTGAHIVTYGSPVLPGAMLMLGYITPDGTPLPENTDTWNENLPTGTVPIIGLPGCVMYAKATVFDIVLPRVIANLRITKADIAALGEGGLCLGCKPCTYPHCGFGK